MSKLGRLFARGTDTSRTGDFYARAATFPTLTVEVLVPTLPSQRRAVRKAVRERIREVRRESRDLARQISAHQRTTPAPSRRARLLAAREGH